MQVPNCTGILPNVAMLLSTAMCFHVLPRVATCCHTQQLNNETTGNGTGACKAGCVSGHATCSPRMLLPCVTIYCQILVLLKPPDYVRGYIRSIHNIIPVLRVETGMVLGGCPFPPFFFLFIIVALLFSLPPNNSRHSDPGHIVGFPPPPLPHYGSCVHIYIAR